MRSCSSHLSNKNVLSNFRNESKLKWDLSGTFPKYKQVRKQLRDNSQVKFAGDK